MNFLEPKEAAEAAATLTEAMTKTNDPNALRNLAQGLSAVSGRLEPKEAARVSAQAAAAFTQAMTKTNDTNALDSLAQGLSAVSDRLEPKEAARVSAQAAATLTQAMNKTNVPSYVLVNLADRLSAVSRRLEPKEAAATLTQAMTKKDPNARDSGEGPVGRYSAMTDGSNAPKRWLPRSAVSTKARGCPALWCCCNRPRSLSRAGCPTRSWWSCSSSRSASAPRTAPSSINWDIGTNAASPTSGTSFASPRNRSSVSTSAVGRNVPDAEGMASGSRNDTRSRIRQNAGRQPFTRILANAATGKVFPAPRLWNAETSREAEADFRICSGRRRK